VFYCTFVFLYNTVSDQLARLLLINNNIHVVSTCNLKSVVTYNVFG